VTDDALDVGLIRVSEIEAAIRRHLLTASGAFEQDRGMKAYRATVATRKAMEDWIVTRARQKQESSNGEVR